MTRFGVSLERGLLERFDACVKDARHRNRSAALREIVRDYLVARTWSDRDEPIAALVGLVYHNEARGIAAAVQKHLEQARTLVHGDSCHYLHARYTVRVLVLQGPAPAVRALADACLGCKGIVHGNVIPLLAGPPCGVPPSLPASETV
jgi:CopG family nickel-responsive transcriptional regulator